MVTRRTLLTAVAASPLAFLGGDAGPIHIMSMGHSIPAGWPAGSDAYRPELSRLLDGAGVTHTLDVSARWGATAGEVREFGPAAVAAARPDLVVLDVGVNDAARSDDTRAAFRGEFAALLRELAGAGPGTRVLVVEQGRTQIPEWWSWVDAVNGQVREVCGAPAGRRRVSRLLSFPAVQAHLADGVHPDPVGYALMGRDVYGAVMAAYGRSPRRWRAVA